MLLFFYNILLPFALLFSFPLYLRRMIKRGGYARNFSQRFGRYSKDLADRFAEGGWTWIRAVSVGEIVMALRLIAGVGAGIGFGASGRGVHPAAIATRCPPMPARCAAMK